MRETSPTRGIYLDSILQGVCVYRIAESWERAVKMSDMDEDFMYDQDDDYGLVGLLATLWYYSN